MIFLVDASCVSCALQTSKAFVPFFMPLFVQTRAECSQSTLLERISVSIRGSGLVLAIEQRAESLACKICLSVNVTCLYEGEDDGCVVTQAVNAKIPISANFLI